MSASEGPRTVLVVGGGVMGSGIALACALGSQCVLLVDVDAAALARVRAAVQDKWRFMVEAGLLGESTRPLVDGIDYRVQGELEELAGGIDICFEAVPDDLAIKQAVFAGLLACIPDGVPIASNSGNLSVDEIASPLPRRGWVLSAHWINPPHLMLPVEVAPGTHTEAAAVDATVAFLQGIGKRPVRLRRDVPGRIANRLHFALLNEAIRLVEAGVASPEDIDTAVSWSFMPRMLLFGAFGAHDVYGRKRTSYKTFEYLHRATGDPAYAPRELMRRKAELEEQGNAAASRWRTACPPPDRRTCDRRVAALLQHLVGLGENPWSHGQR